MKDDEFLGTLQDPLMTLLGIILLASLWVVIPSEPRDAVDMRAVQTQIDHVSALLDERIDARWKREVRNRRMARQIAHPDDPSPDAAGIQARIRELREDVDAYRQRIASQARLNAGLHDELERSRDIVGRLRALAGSERAWRQTLESQARILTAERRELDRELAGLRRVAGAGTGIAEPVTPPPNASEKRFEVDGEHLYRIDDDNYDIKPDRALSNASRTRRPGAKGDAAWELDKGRSQFHRLLERSRPDLTPLFFFVREDAFDTFLKARRIAFARGFAVGWHFQTDETLTFTLSGGGRKPEFFGRGERR